MNRTIKTIYLLGQGMVLYLYLKMNIIIPCLFLKFFHLKCPTCGMTRAFLAILDLDFSLALYYNLLSIPLFILIIIVDIMMIYDIITNQKRTNHFLNQIAKHYIFIIILLLGNMLINNLT